MKWEGACIRKMSRKSTPAMVELAPLVQHGCHNFATIDIHPLSPINSTDDTYKFPELSLWKMFRNDRTFPDEDPEIGITNDGPDI